jgi:hypothetical protein
MTRLICATTSRTAGTLEMCKLDNLQEACNPMKAMVVQCFDQDPAKQLTPSN